MFFGGKKVVVAKKATSVSVVDANKRAREDRERERVKQNQINFVQACIRQHRVLLQSALDIRAHWIVENPHFTLDAAPNRVEWLLRAFREFLFITQHLRPFDASTLAKLAPLLTSEYTAIAFIPEYRERWLWQAMEAVILGIRNFDAEPTLWSQLLRYLTHPPLLAQLAGSAVRPSTLNEIITTFHRRLGPTIEQLLKVLAACPNLTSQQLPLLQLILDVLDHIILTDTAATAVVQLASKPFPVEIFSNGSFCAQLLATTTTSLKYLDMRKINYMVPITEANYVEASQFVINKMKLYSCMTGATSIEVFAAEIALQLEQINDFEKVYHKQLEDEEDFLDANDVPDIEQRYRQTRQAKETLKITMLDVSSAATTIFSEERLFGLISKLSEISDKTRLLDSFESIAVLMSRLKNTIGISTGAFLALSSPLIPLWPTIRERYSKGLSVPEIDQVAPLLSLYCQSYAFYLSTKITDSDFYTKQQYLTMDQIKGLVKFFKALIHDRCDVRFSMPLSDVFISLMKSVNMLMLQLQARNHERTWAKTDELLMVNLKARNLANSSHKSHPIALYCPAFIPMVEKVHLFNHWVTSDRQKHQDEGAAAFFGLGGMMGLGGGGVTVNIRRGPMLLTDAFQKLMPLHSRLKEKLRVQFQSEDGTPEAGIDGGGLFRELFTEVVKLAFSPDFGLFSATEEHSLYPNPNSSVLVDDDVRKFQFLGQLLGKCIYESLLVDLPFALFFLNILQGQKNTMRDLASYDPMLFQSLQQLLDMPRVEDLGLTFEFSVKESDGTSQEVALVPGGRDKVVTTQNVTSYVQAIVDLRLNRAVEVQAKAFMRGLADVIDVTWLQLFTAPELSLAICGGGRLDIEDLRQNVVFAAGFHADHPTVLLLWETLEEFSSEEQQAFLRFVTSVSRPPILGFASLHPRLCLRLNQTEVSYLPTANTCLNLLKLPPYPTKQLLKQKLLYAINSGARFELS